MKNLILAAVFAALSVGAASAQSGLGGIHGFVASSFHNGSAISNVKVELTVIENHSGTKPGFTTSTITKGGYYDMEVSFGYYLLTISAEGYETYKTKVYIISSSTLEWATILEKVPAKSKAKNRH